MGHLKLTWEHSHYPIWVPIIPAQETLVSSIPVSISRGRMMFSKTSTVRNPSECEPSIDRTISLIANRSLFTKRDGPQIGQKEESEACLSCGFDLLLNEDGAEENNPCLSAKGIRCFGRRRKARINTPTEERRQTVGCAS